MKTRFPALCCLVPLTILAPSCLQAARVTSVTLCEQVVEPDLVPVNIRTRFASEAPAIHALAVVEGLSSGSRIRGTWVSVDAVAQPNREIDAAEVAAAAGEATAHFSLSRPDSGWPSGNYKLTIHVDGRLVSVTTFTIGGAPAAVAGPAQAQSQAHAGGVGALLGGQPAGSPAHPGPVESPAGGGFTGRYVLENQGVQLTLELRQDAQGGITGSLASTKGTRFQVEGQVQDDVAMGACSGGGGKVFFEAQMQGAQLLLALIEPDANNMPDYSRTQSLMFSREGGAETASATPGRPQPSPGPSGTPAGATPSAGEVGDPSWAFRLRVPAGWKIQSEAGGALLGHDSVPGVILVFPHNAANVQEVQQQMMEGLSDQSGQLAPTGRPATIGGGAIAANYQGFWQGKQVQARGIGTCSPQGGGAFILAIATPEVFSPELAEAAEQLATGMRFVAPQAAGGAQAVAGAQGAGGAQFLVGTWVTMTSNTQTTYTLMADGTFASGYEASYSATPNSAGTNDWGLARQDSNRGRWTARGTREQGTLMLQFPDGRQESVEYRVHVEGGETYWREYYFDGVLYGRQ
jgi:hypothetical protein